MNRKLLITLLAVAGVLSSSVAQSPPADSNSALIQQTMKEVQTQQVEIAANQAKIDEKIATLAEAIRVARLYSARGGH